MPGDGHSISRVGAGRSEPQRGLSRQFRTEMMLKRATLTAIGCLWAASAFAVASSLRTSEID